MDKIILVGAGGHARSCIDVLEMSGQFFVAGLIEKDNLNNNDNLGYSIIGTDKDLINFRQNYDNALITVGQIKTAEIRSRLYQVLNQLNYSLPVIISPNSYVSKHTKIGEGTIIMHNTIVNANAQIGKNCIINNKALIEHDAKIGDHCHISTGVIINGDVIVGNKCFVGSGAIIRQAVSIGNNCVIGAGVVVKNDINPDQIINK
jgi:sugar O-acyltransferase (sialic acid O-acetyltransferase NeuD family)